MMTDGHKTNEATTTISPSETKSTPRGAVTNAGWNAFSTVWNIGISFILAPLLIHYLGTAEYGILLLIWSFTGILGIMNFGLGEATLRYVAHYYGDGDYEGVNRVFGSTLSFYVVICAGVSLIVVTAAPSIVALMKIPDGQHQLVGWLLRVSCLIFSLGIVTRAFGSIPMALHRYDISSKIEIGQSVVRSTGYIVLVISKFGLLHLLMWDVITSSSTLLVQFAVIRRLSPQIRLLPSFSFKGLREIFSYSIFSFLTYVFHMMHRESGKLALGSLAGPAPVAYLGTPDNVSQRVHMVVASSSETLLPRFSANRDPRVAQSLFLSGTWAALALSIVFFIPLIVLMPDFLSLWISPEFSKESAAVGQLVALSYITQGGFAPPATFFRGTGKPWVVTIIIALAGIVTLVSSLILIPSMGVLGVGYAYLLGSIAPLLGVMAGWLYLFGSSAVMALMRSVGLPLLLGAGAFMIEQGIRNYFIGMNWFELIALGGLFAALTGLLVFGVDWLLGGDSFSRKFFEQIARSEKVARLSTHFGFGRAH